MEKEFRVHTNVNKQATLVLIFLFIFLVAMSGAVLGKTLGYEFGLVPFFAIFACIYVIIGLWRGPRILSSRLRATLIRGDDVRLEPLNLISKKFHFKSIQIRVFQSLLPLSFSIQSRPGFSTFIISETLFTMPVLNQQSIYAYLLSQSTLGDDLLGMWLMWLVEPCVFIWEYLQQKKVNPLTQTIRIATTGFTICSFIAAAIRHRFMSRNRIFLIDALSAIKSERPRVLAELIAQSSYSFPIDEPILAFSHLGISFPYRQRFAASVWDTFPPVEQRVKILNNM